jgi:hypothetical protein
MGLSGLSGCGATLCPGLRRARWAAPYLVVLAQPIWRPQDSISMRMGVLLIRRPWWSALGAGWDSLSGRGPEGSGDHRVDFEA